LVDAARSHILAAARVEEIGGPACRLITPDGERALGGEVGFEEATRLLLEDMDGRAAEHGGLAAVAHRVVHGGERVGAPARLDGEALRALEELIPLAPLHNGPALRSVRAAMAVQGALPHIAVFDTTFHNTLPRRARLYALPTELCERHGIRRFGFHGI